MNQHSTDNDLSSNSDNSISNDEILTTRDLIESLNLNQDDTDKNLVINTSVYFENIDYDQENDIEYKVYESELQMNEIMTLIQKGIKGVFKSSLNCLYKFAR